MPSSHTSSRRTNNSRSTASTLEQAPPGQRQEADHLDLDELRRRMQELSASDMSSTPSTRTRALSGQAGTRTTSRQTGTQAARSRSSGEPVFIENADTEDEDSESESQDLPPYYRVEQQEEDGDDNGDTRSCVRSRAETSYARSRAGTTYAQSRPGTQYKDGYQDGTYSSNLGAYSPQIHRMNANNMAPQPHRSSSRSSIFRPLVTLERGNRTPSKSTTPGTKAGRLVQKRPKKDKGVVIIERR
ncbi:MAG: hypothetical protein LQ340_005358 [Diploschistes diacapsis]|nr:MAG: hypothetical protein LQ340_005358 [Diploschistes diacapsis]